MTLQAKEVNFVNPQFEPLNDSILRILNIILEFRELQKRFFKIDFEDDAMKDQVKECLTELDRLQMLEAEHMKFIIGEI